MSVTRTQVTEAFAAIAGPIARLQRSLGNADGVFPLSSGNLSETEIDSVDQFLQRFQQVTDLALRKLLPRVLAVVTEREKPLFLRDMLDELERLAVISDAAWWVALNDRRNRLIHEYAMTPDSRMVELNAAWHAAAELVRALAQIAVAVRGE